MAGLSSLQPGDVLLHQRGRSLLSWLISVAGRSPYCHAGVADRVGSEWVEIDTTLRRGASAGRLAPRVAASPGMIDVYRPIPSVSQSQVDVAVRTMWRLTSRRYGWLALCATALLHLPVIRLLLRPAWADERDSLLPFCSFAVSRAYREAGVDLVPNLACRYTEPGDLARSALLHFVGSLELPRSAPFHFIGTVESE